VPGQIPRLCSDVIAPHLIALSPSAVSRALKSGKNTRKGRSVNPGILAESARMLDHYSIPHDDSQGPSSLARAIVSQLQMDVSGEMMDALYLCNKYVSPIAYDMWLKIAPHHAAGFLPGSKRSSHAEHLGCHPREPA
jgi:hypothetical protein